MKLYTCEDGVIREFNEAEYAEYNSRPVPVITPVERIAELEAQITPRRIREAVLTDEGKHWLDVQNSLIAAQRALLS